MAQKKVKVRSIYRAVVAKVGEYPVKLPSGQAVMEAVTREFHNWEAYMLPEEATFLVESEENKRCRAAGRARYTYPAGIPLPVAMDFEGPLVPAGRTDSFIAADPMQSMGAKEQLARAAKALAALEHVEPAAPEPPVASAKSKG